MDPLRTLGLLAIAAALCAVAGCRTGDPGAPVLPTGVAQASAAGWSDVTLAGWTARMDPAVSALARRHDPGVREVDGWSRPVGWTSLDMRTAPDLGLGVLAADSAKEINDLRPAVNLPSRPMRAFTLHAGTSDARQAMTCMSQAIYYEAAREPLKGQEAVAQVVLNRLRHPAYPKSVCGVVFQGSARATGCQFSFTCDGSLRWAPEPRLWARAQAVAKRALTGFVMKDVGSATHYHADYVAPYWAPTLVKLQTIGAHIFYRWTGPGGEPAAFTGRYAGGESNLSLAVLGGLDSRTQGLFNPERQGMSAGRKVTLELAGEVRTYTVADAAAVDGKKTRVLGMIYAPRRAPTPDEVKEINASLAAMEKREAAQGGAPSAPAPDPIGDLLPR